MTDPNDPLDPLDPLIKRYRTLHRELEFLVLLASGLDGGRVEIRRSEAGIVTVELAGDHPAVLAGAGATTVDAVRACIEAVGKTVGANGGPSVIP